MVGPLGGDAGDSGTLTINAKNVDSGPPRRRCQKSGSVHHQCKKCRWRPPWEALSEIWECPPPTQKMSMEGPVGGDAGDPGTLTINTKNVDGGPPWEATSEIREHSPSKQKMSTAGPLRGDAGDPGAPTINAKNVNGGPPGRQCRRSSSAHHQRKKHRRWSLGEAMLEIWERPPSMQETSMVGPLGGDVGDAGAPTINTRNIDGGPPGRRCWRSRSAHHQRKKH
jgi:hypothetical protein